jgi:hypothetical protein
MTVSSLSSGNNPVRGHTFVEPATHEIVANSVGVVQRTPSENPDGVLQLVCYFESKNVMLLTELETNCINPMLWALASIDELKPTGV